MASPFAGAVASSGDGGAPRRDAVCGRMSGSVTDSHIHEALVQVLHRCSYCGRNAFAADFVGQPVRAMDAYLQKHISGSCVAV